MKVLGEKDFVDPVAPHTKVSAPFVAPASGRRSDTGLEESRRILKTQVG
ncbi:MAG: hypothetical protein PHQ28_01970 [Mycobacterium sp.]|nr:hypothetical protein [Mycobacterium sp.]